MARIGGLAKNSDSAMAITGHSFALVKALFEREDFRTKLREIRPADMAYAEVHLRD